MWPCVHHYTTLQITVFRDHTREGKTQKHKLNVEALMASNNTTLPPCHTKFKGLLPHPRHGDFENTDLVTKSPGNHYLSVAPEFVDIRIYSSKVPTKYRYEVYACPDPADASLPTQDGGREHWARKKSS